MRKRVSGKRLTGTAVWVGVVVRPIGVAGRVFEEFIEFLEFDMGRLYHGTKKPTCNDMNWGWRH